MRIAIKKLLAQLLFWLYDFLDLIGDIFRVLVGLDPVSSEKGDMSLIDTFMAHSVASKVIFGLVIIGVVIALVCGIVKVISGMVRFKSGGEAPSHTKTIGLTFASILSSMACIFFTMLLIAFSGVLMKEVDGVMRADQSTKFSSYLFDLSVQESYRIDYNNPIYEINYKLDEYGAPIQKVDSNGNPVYETDELGNYVDKDGNVIEDQSNVDLRVPVYELDASTVKYDYCRDENGDYMAFKTGYMNGNTVSDLNFSKQHPNDVFGVHFSISGLEQDFMPYVVQPMVDFDSFNMFTAYLVVIVMIFSLIFLCFGLTKRIYDIIVLFFIMPLICGTIPLDEGTRFKAWRETMLSKVLLAVGAVIAVNVFFLFAPIIQSITISGMTSIVQSIFKMFLYMGAALCINSSLTLFSRVLGTSADESRELAQSARTLISGVMFAGGALRGTKTFLLGGQTKYGRDRKGVIPSVLGHGKTRQAASSPTTASGAVSRWAGATGAGSKSRSTPMNIMYALGAAPGSAASNVQGANGAGKGNSGSPQKANTAYRKNHSGKPKGSSGGAYRNTKKKK